MRNLFRNRLPQKQSVITIFAIAAFLVYGWTIYSSFWKIPSWIYYMKLIEILSIYAYSFVLNFGESIVLTLGVVVVGIFLIDNLWKDGFTAAGLIGLIVTVGSALLHLRLHDDPNLREHFVNSQRTWWVGTFAIALGLSVFCARVAWVRKPLNALADRFVVFLYIYIPLTLLSFIAIIIRMFF